MGRALKRKVERGEYRIDSGAVALAMIDHARALRDARYQALDSEMLVPAEGIEIRRLRPLELDARPLEGAA